MTNLVKGGRLFGTDGVRGIANAELSPYLAMRLGLAASHYFGSGSPTPTFVVGRDSRISSPMLEAALVAGICSMGGVVMTPGLLPTPAVACITREIGADAIGLSVLRVEADAPALRGLGRSESGDPCGFHLG